MAENEEIKGQDKLDAKSNNSRNAMGELTKSKATASDRSSTISSGIAQPKAKVNNKQDSISLKTSNTNAPKIKIFEDASNKVIFDLNFHSLSINDVYTIRRTIYLLKMSTGKIMEVT
jgi:hypothetical protein